MGKKKAARFYDLEKDNRVRCRLCPHNCLIPPGKKGICGVRENVGGRLVSVNYGRITSMAADPVEKKPLYHVEPGSFLLSVGSYGCSFKCEFCQNWPISQGEPRSLSLSPQDIVRAAINEKEAGKKITGIAYTYNEPVVWFEFVRDCAILAKKAGLRNVLVTNGYVSQEALLEILPLVDAMNVDVKAWNDGFYRQLTRGRLGPVLNTISTSVESGTWVEVTYLVIPGKNDDDRSLRGLSRWVSALDTSIPLHLSRYFPAYHSQDPATPLATLERLRTVAQEFLNFVYVGNAWKRGYADTLCPKCKDVLIYRGGMEIETSRLVGDRCPKCDRPLEMIGKVWV